MKRPSILHTPFCSANVPRVPRLLWWFLSLYCGTSRWALIDVVRFSSRWLPSRSLTQSTTPARSPVARGLEASELHFRGVILPLSFSYLCSSYLLPSEVGLTSFDMDQVATSPHSSSLHLFPCLARLAFAFRAAFVTARFICSSSSMCSSCLCFKTSRM